MNASCLIMEVATLHPYSTFGPADTEAAASDGKNFTMNDNLGLRQGAYTA